MYAIRSYYAAKSGGNNSTSQPNTTNQAQSDDGGKIEPFTISAFIGEAGQQPTPDNKIYKMIKEKTGASFEFEFLAGDKDQKLGVMIAGSDYPDIMSYNFV